MTASRSPKIWTSLGLMSGTSLDGVDAAIIRTDGERVFDHGPFLSLPYGDELREEIRACFGAKGDLDGVGRKIARFHALVIGRLLAAHGMAAADLDLVGFHGQTVLHQPALGRTVQIGDGQLLADLVGIDVVDDFRSRDVRAGGEGAPLAPLYHAALAKELERPLAVLNIGGVANVTYIPEAGIPEAGDLLAFDTGPGNALIDDWMLRHTGAAVDMDGRTAARGRISQAALVGMMASPYFERTPPKSLDRDDFAGSACDGLDLADGAATLTELTARAVGLARVHFPVPPKRWLVCGGGRNNPFLMNRLRKILEVPVEPVEAVGWRGDALEAEAFAYLAVRSVKGLALSLPGTTGGAAPCGGGRLHRASASPVQG